MRQRRAPDDVRVYLGAAHDPDADPFSVHHDRLNIPFVQAIAVSLARDRNMLCHFRVQHVDAGFAHDDYPPLL